MNDRTQEILVRIITKEIDSLKDDLNFSSAALSKSKRALALRATIQSDIDLLRDAKSNVTMRRPL